MTKRSTNFLRIIFSKSQFWTKKLKNLGLFKNCKTFKLRPLSLNNQKIKWLTIFLREVGVAILSGAILGAVIENLAWLGVFLLSSASFVMCYTSFTLINKIQDD
jgi:hypothetical protein